MFDWVCLLTRLGPDIAVSGNFLIGRPSWLKVFSREHLLSGVRIIADTRNTSPIIIKPVPEDKEDCPRKG